MPSRCSRCGQAIAAWVRTSNNKPLPLDADGSVHFAACNRAAGSNKPAPAHLAAPKTTRGPGVTHVYATGDPHLPPPWADSLGPFRDFTPKEKAAGVVCVPRAPHS